MDPIRGEGGCVRVSNDNAVDKVFLLPIFYVHHLCSLQFEVYLPVCELEEQLLKHAL